MLTIVLKWKYNSVIIIIITTKLIMIIIGAIVTIIKID